MVVTTWEEILEKIAGYEDGPLKERYLTCACFLSSHDPAKSWLCQLDVYGRLLVSPGPNIWPKVESDRSILIGLPLEDQRLPAMVIGFRNRTLTDTLVTLDNCESELARLVREADPPAA